MTVDVKTGKADLVH